MISWQIQQWVIDCRSGLARTNQIVQSDWNIIDESSSSFIKNKPAVGFRSIDGRSSSAGPLVSIPVFTIPSDAIGVELKIRQLTIENYTEGDVVYLNKAYRKFPGDILQGNNLMVRVYLENGYSYGSVTSIVTKFESEDVYLEQVLAVGMDFIGWNTRQLELSCKSKTLKCQQYDFHYI